MVYGFNIGQGPHEAQKEWKDNGNIPIEFVNFIKSVVPKEQLKVCRMTGTMANQWALDIPGFNDARLAAQINNMRSVPQPDISYMYAFVKFYQDMGFEECIWTMNTISAWSDINARDLWEKRMWGALEFMMSNKINITRICLENEMWMYPQCVYMHRGSRSQLDFLQYGSSVFNNTTFQNNTLRRMREFMTYLQGIARQVRIRYPKIKIAVSGDPAVTTQRSRLLLQVLREFDFYDAVCPHIYIKSASSTETLAKVSEIINPFKTLNKDIWVTESNWKYNDDGSDANIPNSYRDNFFLGDLRRSCEINGVDVLMHHCLWMGRSAYGWVR